MSIQTRIDEIQDELELFDEVLDKYEYIIDIGKRAQILSDEYKTKAYLVQGCQSKVWLHIYMQEDKVILEADSEAFIVKGLVHILIRIYSNNSALQISESNTKDLNVLGLNEIISSGRQNGIHSMLDKIYSFAKEAQDA